MSAPQVRLHDPSEPAPASSASPTLAEAWETLTKPELATLGRSRVSLDDYERHVRRFGLWWTETQVKDGDGGELVLHHPDQTVGLHDTRITYPGVASIAAAHLQQYRDWVRSRFGGERTANKHLQSVKSVLRDAASHGHIAAAPGCRGLPHQPQKPRRYLTAEECGRLYEAAARATWPRGRPAGAEWQTLIVLLWNWGSRPQELVRYKSPGPALAWGDVLWQQESPQPESDLRCPWGWALLGTSKTAHHASRAGRLVMPLNRATLAHLARLFPGRDATSPVFPWPTANKSFYRQWSRIVQAADLPEAKRALNVEDLRKTCATQAGRQFRATIPDAGDVLEGRTPRTVGGRHYDNRERDRLTITQALLQPEPFLARLPSGIEPALPLTLD